MAYVPKSKVSVKETSGGEFIERYSRKPYTGMYMELSNGRYYIGSNILKRGPELIVAQEPTTRKFGDTRDFKKHTILNKTIFNRLKKYKQIPISNSFPSEEDYTRGYYNRYFAKRINSQYDYFEINKITHSSLSSKKEEYDYNLYNVGVIKWALKGNTRKINNLQVQLAEKSFPFISRFFRKLNEYERPEVIENQIAEPGELVYRNNISKEYVGPYHIHPVQGPMVGAKHVSEPHETLVFVTDIPQRTDGGPVSFDAIFDGLYEEYLKELERQRNIESIGTTTDKFGNIITVDQFGNEVSLITDAPDVGPVDDTPVVDGDINRPPGPPDDFSSGETSSSPPPPPPPPPPGPPGGRRGGFY